MARKRKVAKPRRSPRTHKAGPSAQDFHFSADEERAMRKGAVQPEGPEDEAPDAEEVGED